MRRIIAIRKETKVFGRGSFSIIDVDNPHIFAFERCLEGERVVCAFNFSRAMQSVGLPLSVGQRTPVRDMIGGSMLHDARTRGKYQITLGPRGYAWLRIGECGA
jgi:maltose alpha-D-glucosyltransferase/alpha-amylase